LISQFLAGRPAVTVEHHPADTPVPPDLAMEDVDKEVKLLEHIAPVQTVVLSLCDGMGFTVIVAECETGCLTRWDHKGDPIESLLHGRGVKGDEIFREDAHAAKGHINCQVLRLLSKQ